jgi:hypothetical protein
MRHQKTYKCHVGVIAGTEIAEIFDVFDIVWFNKGLFSQSCGTRHHSTIAIRITRLAGEGFTL